MEEFKLKNETYQILGACIEVYNAKGCGFPKAVHQECLELGLGFQNIPFRAKESLRIDYKGPPLKQTYEPDFICFEKVVVEIKATKDLCNDHRAQLLNDLNATGIEVGLLINFGHFPKFEYERIVNTKKKP